MNHNEANEKLHHAAKYGDVSALREALAGGAEVNAMNKDCLSSLMLARGMLSV
jgi:hypothetical protein